MSENGRSADQVAAGVPGWVAGYDPPQGGVGAPPVVRRSDRSDRTGGDETARVAAGVRAAIGDELSAQIAAAEARGGGVLGAEARRQIADALVTSALERWAQTELAAGRGLLGAAGEASVRRAVLDGLFGLGGLQPLLDDPDIENINVNGCDDVFVRYCDGRRARMPAVAGSDGELVELVRQLAARSGVQERRFDPGAPMLNLQLPDGSRLFAVMAVSRRPAISVRRHRYRRITLAELGHMGTVDGVLAGFLAAAVRARMNIVVAGGTGVGKTTLLMGLASEIGPSERLVTIEDAFELGLDEDRERHPDVVAWQSREANTEGEGEITQAELARAALRASPDRVIVGEIRGPEVVPVCNVMSQGNDGSMATIHASSARGVFAKMAAYAAQGPERLPVEATA
ncbi:CpaF family protein, partial [Pseudonocardia sp.]|uniref:CpaF family protein n=1 Tax=Pseudonocardia sp. TaxID=60912 RepID=UPI003D0E43C6